MFISYALELLKKASGEPQLKYIKDYFNDLIKLIKNKKSFIKNTKAKKYIFIKSTIPQAQSIH